MIYILRVLGSPKCDSYTRKIVRAESETRARTVANWETGREGNIWTDPEKVSCEVVNQFGESAVLMDEYYSC